MALKGETRIGVRHSLSVVDHLDGCLSRIHHKHVDAAGSGVNGVLHQFLDDRRGALYHLTGCYLVGHGIGQQLYYIAHILSVIFYLYQPLSGCCLN